MCHHLNVNRAMKGKLLHCDLYCAWYLFLYPKKVVLNLFDSKAFHYPRLYSKAPHMDKDISACISVEISMTL